ncbi:MAG: stage III sporulation protein AE, partial [Clostridia bacterium]|nr:stage III sporulation protein AE [Clostridia bacterium]
FTVCLMVVVFALFTPQCALASSVEDELNQTINGQIDKIDFSDVSQFEDGTFVEDIVQKIKQILSGDFDDASTFVKFAFNVLFSNFSKSIPTLLSVFAIILLCSLLTTNNAFVSQGNQKVIYAVGFVFVCVLIFADLGKMYNQVYSTIGKLSQLVDTSMPIMLSLMIATGNKVSAKVYQPMVALLSGTIIKGISQVILPLATFSLAFTIISNLSDNVKIGKLTGFVNNTSSWLLGITFMLFSAFMTVEGISATSLDGVSIRAMKFATKNYVPMLGGYLSDGFDMIVASATLIKNSFGLVTLLMLFGIVLSPILNVLAYKLTLQALCAVLEPVCDKRYLGFFSSINKNLTFLIVLLIAVSFMFSFLLTLTIYTANG